MKWNYGVTKRGFEKKNRGIGWFSKTNKRCKENWSWKRVWKVARMYNPFRTRDDYDFMC